MRQDRFRVGHFRTRRPARGQQSDLASLRPPYNAAIMSVFLLVAVATPG
jgi:hypothetical protein